MFGTLYIYTLIGLLLNLVTDLTYVAIDPRIDFASREGRVTRTLDPARRAAALRQLPRPTGAASGRSGSSWRCSG